MTAYSEFWRKAAEDYAKEMGTMTKLMTSVTTKLTYAAQSATDEASKNVVSTLKAA